MVHDNHWEVIGEIRLYDRREFHIDNQLEDGMDEIQRNDEDEYSKRESNSSNPLFIYLTSNDGHPVAFFNCENDTLVNLPSAFFHGNV
jgi:hypothetical protein